MSRKHLATVTALIAIAALAFAAAATSSGTAARTQRAAAATGSTTQIGTVNVRLTIKRFVRHGKRLYAVGAATARFLPTDAQAGTLPTATATRPFTARVKSIRRLASADRICPILSLTLGPLDLNLLGLIVHLDQTHLVITADSEGGILGQLLCGLTSGHHGSHARAAKRLTRAMHRSGLSTRGLRFAVPLYQTSSGGVTTLTTGAPNSPMVICPILDLTLGPLDLNLLGLMVHLDTVHLVITADSEGGILGQLLCGLAGGGGGSPGS